MSQLPAVEQRITVQGHNVMTYSWGVGTEALLLIAGGPGAPSIGFHATHQHYARHGLRVVTWDQLGCGKSDHPTDSALWQLPRFVEEVEIVRQTLGLQKVHLLGQSWGGILALEYCLTYPACVQTLIIVNSAFNIPLMQRGFERYKLALGSETVRMMARHEAAGTTAHPEYQAAVTLLSRRHACRLSEWPAAFAQTTTARPMLETVIGKYQFNCTGTLRNYDRTDALHKIQQPCLIIHGEYDLIIPECAILTRDHLPNAELHVLGNCSHATFYEDPATYHRLLANFLQQHCDYYKN